MPKTRKTAIAAVVVLILSGFAASPAAEPEHRFSLGVVGIPGDARAATAATLAAKVREVSGGRIRLDVVRDEGAGGAAHMSLVEGVIRGTTDIALLEHWALGQKFALLGSLSRPFLFADVHKANEFVNGDGGRRVAEIVAEAGPHVIGWVRLPSPLFAVNRSFSDMDGLEGLTVAAVPNPLLRRLFAELGVVLAPLPDARLGESLASGLLGGAFLEADVIVNDGFPDALRAVSESFDDYPCLAICVSGQLWSSLSPEERDLLSSGLLVGAQAAMASAEQSNVRARTEWREAAPAVVSIDPAALREKADLVARSLERTTDSRLVELLKSASRPTIIF